MCVCVCILWDSKSKHKIPKIKSITNLISFIEKYLLSVFNVLGTVLEVHLGIYQREKI